jgi:hypothetical protein
MERFRHSFILPSLARPMGTGVIDGGTHGDRRLVNDSSTYGWP